MRRGKFAAFVVAVIAIALLGHGYAAVGTFLVNLTASDSTGHAAIMDASSADRGVSLGTLAMRDTPENPPGTVSLGIDWTPWIVLGVALAAFAAVGLAFLRLRGRRPQAPATGPIDRLPDDWPEL